MLKDQSTLSISLVTYKPNLEVLAKTLRHLHISILATPKLTAHLYIVDNSCDTQWQSNIISCMEENFVATDSIKVEFIVSPGNIGYGKSNNIAIKAASSKYHLVINPDLYTHEDTISEALKYMETHVDTGLLTPAVYGENGDQHYLCKTNPTLFMMFLRSFAPQIIKNRYADYMQKFEMRDKNYGEVILNIPHPTGCFMFFRTNILKKIDGFSDDFFMYYEDADIGRRTLNHAKSAYVPQVKVIHKWARGSHTSLKLRWITIQSAITYWRKWGGLF